ncbi:hypothetical protein [Sutterella wadsworthensis]|uniref:hypothetical protein n=1 Tax=Sutterella wadsworthensis TaxID=40545 RepID=UPI0011BEB6DB|nr:hypothetical protein [Sutterella wadsworthensis]QQS89172.1 hypothetical protein I6J16_08465 [Sutterella wadsworthensis]
MNWQTVVALMLMSVSFMAGYTTRGYVADAEMANLQKTEAVARVTQGRKNYERLVAALDKVAAADVDLDRIRRDADRMRRAYESRLRKASAAACNLEQAAVARCENLLRESVELIEEGRSLLLRNAAVHDALVSTHD